MRTDKQNPYYLDVMTGWSQRDRQFDRSLLSTTAARTSSSETLRVILHCLSPRWELICSMPWSLRVLHADKTSPLVRGQNATCTYPHAVISTASGP